MPQCVRRYIDAALALLIRFPARHTVKAGAFMPRHYRFPWLVLNFHFFILSRKSEYSGMVKRNSYASGFGFVPRPIIQVGWSISIGIVSISLNPLDMDGHALAAARTWLMSMTLPV
jgi:hypothetical protein